MTPCLGKDARLSPLPAGTAASSRVGPRAYVSHRPDRTLLRQIVEQCYPAVKANLAEYGSYRCVVTRLIRKAGFSRKTAQTPEQRLR